MEEWARTGSGKRGVCGLIYHLGSTAPGTWDGTAKKDRRSPTEPETRPEGQEENQRNPRRLHAALWMDQQRKKDQRCLLDSTRIQEELYRTRNPSRRQRRDSKNPVACTPHLGRNREHQEGHPPKTAQLVKRTTKMKAQNECNVRPIKRTPKMKAQKEC